MTQSPSTVLDGVRPKLVFFSGSWVNMDDLTALGWIRHLATDYGAFYYERNGDGATRIWETSKFWMSEEAKAAEAAEANHAHSGDIDDTEDLYGID
jgi:hypothetical protein